MKKHLDPEIWQDLGDSPSESTFTDIHQQTAPIVWSICKRILKDHEDASDAFQGCYARLLVLAKQEHSPPPDHSLESLLARLAVLEADRLRKNRANRQKKESVMEGWEDHPDEQATGFAAAIIQEEVREKLVQLIEELPDHLGIAVSLHYLDGLTQQQIGDALGITQGAVNHRLKSALEKLRPKCLSIGLKDITVVLGTLAGTAALVSPPASLSAASIYTSTMALSQSAGFAPPLLSSLKIIKSGLLGGKALLATAASMVAIVSIMIATAITSPGNKANNQLSGSTNQPAVMSDISQTGHDLLNNDDSGSDQQVKTGLPQEQPDKDANGQTPLNRQIQLTWLDQSEGSSGPVPVENATLKPFDTDLVFISNEDGVIDLGDTITDESFKASILHPHGVTWVDEITLSESTSTNIELQKAGTVSGLLYFEENQQPATNKTLKLQWIGSGRPPLQQDYYATTNNKGQYSFVINDPSEYLIRANHKQYIDQTINGKKLKIETTASKNIDAGVLLLVEGASLSGTITTEDETPINGAGIYVSHKEINLETTTNEEGKYLIQGIEANKEFMVAVQKRGYVTNRIKLRLKEKENRSLSLPLEKGGVLEVAILNEKGEYLTNPSIHKDVNYHHYILYPDKIRENGNVLYTDITKKGINSLSFGAPGYVRLSKEYIFPSDVSSDFLEIQLPQQPPRQLVAFTGSVQTEDGEPIEGAEISYRTARIPCGKQAVTDQEGKYKLEVFKVYDYSICLAVQDDGYATLVKPALQYGTPEKPAQVNFTMAARNWMEISIYTPEGKLLKESNPVFFYTSLKDKHFRILSLTPREYNQDEVSFSFDGFPNEPISVNISHESFVTYKGVLKVNQRHEITLDPKGMIMGEVIDKESQSPIQDFTVTLSENKHDNYFHTEQHGVLFSDPEGLFSLSNIPNKNFHYVTVWAKRYSPAMKHIQPTSIMKTTPFLFELNKIEEVTIIIIDDETDRPIPNVAISGIQGDSVSWEDFTRSLWTIRTDEMGRATLDKNVLSQAKKSLYFAVFPPKPYAKTLINAQHLSWDNDKTIIQLKKGCTLNIRFAENVENTIQGRLDLTKTQHGPKYGYCQDTFGHTIYNSSPFAFDQMGNGSYNAYIAHQGKYLTLKQDINLETPGKSYDLVLTNPGGPGKLYGSIRLDGKIPPEIYDISVSLTPLFDSAQYSYRCDMISQDRYSFDNIPLGKYQLELNLADHTQRKPIRTDETITIIGELNNPINIGSGNRVSINFPPENRNTGYVIKGVEINNHSYNPDGPDNSGSFAQQGNKWVTIGKFKGEYTIELTLFKDGKKTPYTLPDPIIINNMKNDLDLGTITLPKQMGTVNLHLTYIEETTVFESVRFISLINEQGEVVASNETDRMDISFQVPPGNYTVNVVGSHGLHESSPNIIVKANESSDYTLNLSAIYFIYAQINDEMFDLQDLTGAIVPIKYVINGPNYHKEIKPVQLNGSDPDSVAQVLMKSGATEYSIEGSLILMFNEPGNYTITVYSDEYEPYAITLPATAQPNPTVIPIGEFIKKTD